MCVLCVCCGEEGVADRYICQKDFGVTVEVGGGGGGAREQGGVTGLLEWL